MVDFIGILFLGLCFVMHAYRFGMRLNPKIKNTSLWEQDYTPSDLKKYLEVGD